MLKLYTSSEYFKKDGILYVDAYFNNNVSGDMLEEKELSILARYEKAKLIGNGLLDGRYGIFHLSNVSSGVKTLIVLSLISRGILAKPNFINLTECGDNVLDEAFKLVESLNIPCMLNHVGLYGCQDIECIVNDKHRVYTNYDLVEVILSEIMRCE